MHETVASTRRVFDQITSSTTFDYSKQTLEGFISPEIFIYFFIYSDANATQTQMLTLKLFPNRTLTQTLT